MYHYPLPKLIRMLRPTTAHLLSSSCRANCNVRRLIPHAPAPKRYHRAFFNSRHCPVMASYDTTPVEDYKSRSAAAGSATSAQPPVPASSSQSQSQSSQPTNLVVHHLNNSRSQRILWLLEELQLPYTITRYQRTSAGLAPPELVAVHSLGKSPVITDDGRTVAESGAIVDYIIARYGSASMSVSDYDERLSVNYWSHAAEGSFMPPLVMLQVFSAVREKTPWLVRPVASAITHAVETSYINPTTQKLFEMTEQHLKANRAKGLDFFVGSHLTAADFMMLFPLEAIHAGGRGPVTLGSETSQWVERIHARDAYKRALQKGGKYAYAKM